MKKQISGKEDSRPQTVNAIAEAKLCLHLQRGKTNINPIKIVNDVDQKQKWDQVAKQFADDAGSDFRRRPRSLWGGNAVHC